ncbi:hypothetical protein H9P43_007211 [Blastocladiella emersonii ATCC 22665]|nr:hypothetical protein H9P43_007211 [Blastocladiella emersonii ATCC 22665]
MDELALLAMLGADDDGDVGPAGPPAEPMDVFVPPTALPNEAPASNGAPPPPPEGAGAGAGGDEPMETDPPPAAVPPLPLESKQRPVSPGPESPDTVDDEESGGPAREPGADDDDEDDDLADVDVDLDDMISGDGDDDPAALMGAAASAGGGSGGSALQSGLASLGVDLSGLGGLGAGAGFDLAGLIEEAATAAPPPLPLPPIQPRSAAAAGTPSSSPRAKPAARSMPPMGAFPLPPSGTFNSRPASRASSPAPGIFRSHSPPTNAAALARKRAVAADPRWSVVVQLCPEFADDGPLSYHRLLGSRAAFRLRPRTLDYRGRFYSASSRRSSAAHLALEDDERDAFERGKSRNQQQRNNLFAVMRGRGLARLPVIPEEVSDVSSDDDSSDEMELDNMRKFMPVVLASWEDKIVWNEEDADRDLHPILPLLAKIQEGERANPNMSILPVRNGILDSDEWLRAWDDEDWLQGPLDDFAHDPTLLLPSAPVTLLTHADEHALAAGAAAAGDAIHAVDRFNLSNDEFYVSAKKADSARTGNQIVLQHAPPALRLVPAFYKTDLQAKESRRLHRPQFTVEPGLEIKFSKVKALKKKKIKGKENVELLKSSRDMTLKDSANFILLEYSEESPILLSNVGMATFVFNFYRKREEKDQFVPQAEIGAPNILEPDEPGPFWGYGDIDKGHTMPVLFNNMIHAPLFPHAPPETDFLLIRNTYKGVVKYYVREIPRMFVVGQVLPAVEVPVPTSRIYTEYKRNRIRVAVYRLLKKKADHVRKGVKFQDVQNMFAHYAEVQLKSRLKEFMEGRGLASGHWRLKNAATVPSEEEIRKMVTPEQVCMYETMSAAVRQLEDLGYVTDINVSAGSAMHRVNAANTNNAASHSPAVQLEGEMSPWKLTKNFAQAITNKIFLKLSGDGDPTGCGEGFSFLRAGPREKFGKAVGAPGLGGGGSGGAAAGGGGASSSGAAGSGGAASAAGAAGAAQGGGSDDHLAYRQQVREIWDRQTASLSRVPKKLDDPLEVALAKAEASKLRAQAQRASAAGSTAGSPASGLLGGPHGATAHHAQPLGKPGQKALVIRRLLKGMKVWQEEIVTDPHVIENYKRKKALLDNAGEGSALDKFRKQKFMSESRGANANAIQEVLRKARVVQCRRCGQVGHIKTNREKCPMWADEAAERAALKRKQRDGEDGGGDTATAVDTAASSSSTPAKPAAGGGGGGSSSAGPPAKRVKKRHPAAELSEILDIILVNIRDLPSSKPFQAALSPKQHPEFYAKVHTPRFLSDIVETNKNLQYRSADEFADELRRLHAAVESVYGPAHPLTAAAAEIRDLVEREISARAERLAELAEEVRNSTRAPVPPRGAPKVNRTGVRRAAAVASSNAMAAAAAGLPPPMPASAQMPAQPAPRPLAIPPGLMPGIVPGGYHAPQQQQGVPPPIRPGTSPIPAPLRPGSATGGRPLGQAPVARRPDEGDDAVDIED